MIMRKNFIFLCFLFVCLGNAVAQNKPGKISGSVTDAPGRSAASVSVSLLRSKDSSLVKVAVSSNDGKYEFENIAEGSYFISTTSVGYERQSSPLFTVSASNSRIQVADLVMVAAAKGLSEVT